MRIHAFARFTSPLLAPAFALLLSHATTPWALAAADAPRWSVGFEAGPVWQSKNDVAVPGDTGTRFALDEVTGSGPFPFARLEGTYRFSEKQELRGLAAPLRIDEDGVLGTPVLFDGVAFAPGPTTARYQFDSYRFTWRYTVFASSGWAWKLGATGFVRDASIELRQGVQSARESNGGFVPLLHVYGDGRLAERWRFLLDFDGLVGPNGRAFDLGLKLAYELTPAWSLEAGYRVLEGGADTDTAYNFALFQFGVLGARVSF